MSSDAAEKSLSTKRDVEWFYVMLHIQLIIGAVGGLYIAVFDAYWSTLFFTLFIILLGNLGATAGAHRLWAHRTYNATTSLKVFLMLCHTLTGTGSIAKWVKLHRLHHKHYGTELDPFNISKGFFHAHFTSSVLALSPAQEKALEEIDMEDIEKDKIVMFQDKFYYLMYAIVTLLLPINFPAEYLGETILNSAMVTGFLRIAITCHLSFFIHSASKIVGLEPGEKYPCDTNLVFILTKNYWLSYHYLAPWDYQTGEYGKYGVDCGTKFIKVCEALDLATDLKTVSSQTVRDALVMAVTDKKPISKCLFELQKDGELSKEHFIIPTKFMQ